MARGKFHCRIIFSTFVYVNRNFLFIFRKLNIFCTQQKISQCHRVNSLCATIYFIRHNEKTFSCNRKKVICSSRAILPMALTYFLFFRKFNLLQKHTKKKLDLRKGKRSKYCQSETFNTAIL